MTNKQLADKVEKLGAEFEVSKWPDGSAEFVAIAPDGMQWVSGECIHMVCVYHTHFPETRKQAIDDLLSRISEGIEPLDESVNPQEDEL